MLRSLVLFLLVWSSIPKIHWYGIGFRYGPLQRLTLLVDSFRQEMMLMASYSDVRDTCLQLLHHYYHQIYRPARRHCWTWSIQQLDDSGVQHICTNTQNISMNNIDCALCTTDISDLFVVFFFRTKLLRISISDINKWLIFNLHIVQDLYTVVSLDHYKSAIQPTKARYWTVTLSHWIRLFMQIVCVCLQLQSLLTRFKGDCARFVRLAQQTITFIYCAGSSNKMFASTKAASRLISANCNQEMWFFFFWVGVCKRTRLFWCGKFVYTEKMALHFFSSFICICILLILAIKQALQAVTKSAVIIQWFFRSLILTSHHSSFLHEHLTVTICFAWLFSRLLLSFCHFVCRFYVYVCSGPIVSVSFEIIVLVRYQKSCYDIRNTIIVLYEYWRKWKQ